MAVCHSLALTALQPMKSSSISNPPKGKEPSADERQVLVTLYGNRQYADAEMLARALTRQHPKHPLAWKVLGASLKKLGRTAEALQPMQKAAVLMPKDHEAFNNLGVIFKDLGKTEQAIGCYRQALALKPDYADAHGNLGAALRDQGKLPEALAAYKRKLALAPDDAETRHHVDALSGTTTDGAPLQYVEGVFDNYAGHFDTHLTQTLRYNIPAQMAELLQQRAPVAPGVQRVLDLGCGTGLVGAALPANRYTCIGVDVSAGMLQKAQERQRYERLERSDLLSMMQAEQDASYDVVTSADVFVYIGKIDEVVGEARRLLKAGGLFTFSVEAVTPDQAPPCGFRLTSSGRYAHTEPYLRQLAASHGFTMVTHLDTSIRVEQGRAIAGALHLWQV